MKKYSIREFANTFGLSPDAIRYYEKNQLLCSKRNTQNNYRYYTDEDCQEIVTIRLLRSLGLSIKDIRDSKTSDMECKIEDSIRRHQLEIQQQVEWLTLSLERLNYYADVLGRIRHGDLLLGINSVRKNYCFFNQMFNDDLIQPGTPENVTFPLYEHLPVTTPAVIVEGIGGDELCYYSGLLLEQEYAQRLDISNKQDDSFVLEDCIRVITAFPTTSTMEEEAEIMRQIQQYCNSLGVQVANRALGIIVPAMPDQNTNYLDLYLPINEGGKNEKSRFSCPCVADDSDSSAGCCLCR